jgi:hypothetical protein
MRNWMLMLVFVAGLATFTTGCKVEGEVGEEAHIPTVSLS